ncbi:GNAT family N-acetyltransferase [Flexibacterium corallicola]|uniref:GNAT family N-acetyltransferase n=1 Tax=Flexibacterium corallicola TaxID=3037259 RepID=UPI00286F168D|nr:GNAT family N-acetyltransferase [Pseudovibrio sp. M1P-2-3]
MDEKAKVLTGVPIEEMHEAMQRAFSDYVVPMHMSPAQFQGFLEWRGYCPQTSAGLWVEDKLACFWLNSKPLPELKGRCYTLSTGTVPEQRKKGLLSKVCHEAIELAKAQGGKGLQLEVIESNKAARTAYDRLGFERARRLSCFEIPAPHVSAPKLAGCAFRSIPMDALPDELGYFTFQPTVQNSRGALQRLGEGVHVIGCFNGARLCGWLAVIEASGTIAQLAVHEEYRRQNIASTLLHKAAAHTGDTIFRFLNMDSRDEGFKQFVMALGGREYLAQEDMVLGF